MTSWCDDEDDNDIGDKDDNDGGDKDVDGMMIWRDNSEGWLVWIMMIFMNKVTCGNRWCVGS